MTIRLAHVADLHLGYSALREWRTPEGRNQREEDTYAAWHRTVESIITENEDESIDVVLIAGDIFHAPLASPRAARHFAQGLDALIANDLPVVICSGNHDTFKMRGMETMLTVMEAAYGPDRGVFWAVNHTHISCPAEDFALPVIALPWSPREDIGFDTSVITKFDLPSDPARHLVIFAHGDIARDGDTYGVTQDGRTHWFPGMDPAYIAMGHIHTGGSDGCAHQSGSLERLGWRDADAQPGWNLVTIDDGGTSVDRRPIRTRPFVDLGTIDWNDIARELNPDVFDPHDDPEAVARIMVINVPPDQDRNCRTILANELLGRFGHLSIDTLAPGVTRTTGLSSVWSDSTLTALPQWTDLLTEFAATAEGWDDGFRERFREAAIDALDRAAEMAASDDAVLTQD